MEHLIVKKNNIKQILSSGTNKGIKLLSYHVENPDYLKHKSIILSDIDDGTVWRLKFKYGPRIIELVSYHHRNFLLKWPIEITKIKHVMMMGSLSWDSFEEDDCTILLQMLETRTIKPFKLYALWVFHKHFPYSWRVLYGLTKDEDAVAMIDIVNTDYNGWIEQIYPYEYYESNDSNSYETNNSNNSNYDNESN